MRRPSGDIDADEPDVRVLEGVCEAVVKSARRVPTAMTRSASRGQPVRGQSAIRADRADVPADGSRAARPCRPAFRRRGCPDRRRSRPARPSLRSRCTPPPAMISGRWAGRISSAARSSASRAGRFRVDVVTRFVEEGSPDSRRPRSGRPAAGRSSPRRFRPGRSGSASPRAGWSGAAPAD